MWNGRNIHTDHFAKTLDIALEARRCEEDTILLVSSAHACLTTMHEPESVLTDEYVLNSFV